jgi:hypothetical protein
MNDEEEVFLTKQSSNYSEFQGLTVCFTNLGNLNLLIMVLFKLEPIFATVPTASNNEAHVKSCQRRPEKNHHAALIKNSL